MIFYVKIAFIISNVKLPRYVSDSAIESGRRNFMYGPAGPDLAINLRHIFHLEMTAKSLLDMK